LGRLVDIPEDRPRQFRRARDALSVMIEVDDLAQVAL
jgi:hypothetical protein